MSKFTPISGNRSSGNNTNDPNLNQRRGYDQQQCFDYNDEHCYYDEGIQLNNNSTNNNVSSENKYTNNERFGLQDYFDDTHHAVEEQYENIQYQESENDFYYQHEEEYFQERRQTPPFKEHETHEQLCQPQQLEQQHQRHQQQQRNQQRQQQNQLQQQRQQSHQQQQQQNQNHQQQKQQHQQQQQNVLQDHHKPHQLYQNQQQQQNQQHQKQQKRNLAPGVATVNASQKDRFMTMSCLYTKHKTQKRKVWSEGKLKLDAVNGLMAMYAGDDGTILIDNLLESRNIPPSDAKRILASYEEGRSEDIEFEKYLVTTEPPPTTAVVAAPKVVAKPYQIPKFKPPSIIGPPKQQEDYKNVVEQPKSKTIIKGLYSVDEDELDDAFHDEYTTKDKDNNYSGPINTLLKENILTNHYNNDDDNIYIESNKSRQNNIWADDVNVNSDYDRHYKRTKYDNTINDNNNTSIWDDYSPGKYASSNDNNKLYNEKNTTTTTNTTTTNTATIKQPQFNWDFDF